MRVATLSPRPYRNLAGTLLVETVGSHGVPPCGSLPELAPSRRGIFCVRRSPRSRNGANPSKSEPRDKSVRSMSAVLPGFGRRSLGKKEWTTKAITVSGLIMLAFASGAFR
ncbi:hypothetical protein RHECIAT_CH0002781 [Rhizobium etli CIAT 652]|uniref:Uncharacterized protein n=1 Tax=Rhizobium etli (strain CIAT 652) TaxID=491916 RepID=B3PSN4_RHIE6|nr:hypothetical protein RHECIAT_CH0002781 [Rhizobium etli CIAT 652]